MTRPTAPFVPRSYPGSRPLATARRSGGGRVRAQRGLGLIGLLFGAAFLAMVALVGMQVVPTVTEYFAVKRAVSRAIDGADSAAQIQSAFDRYAAIDDIKAITGRDLLIERDPKSGRWVAEFQYTRKIELFGPASLQLDYRGNSADR